jgi:hypothetical protein
MGGVGTIFERMLSENFDWFLHTVLFYHTRHVVKMQSKSQDESDDDTDDSID